MRRCTYPLSPPYRLLLGMFALVAAGAAPAQTTVHAVLFYGDDCTQCGDVFAYALPLLYEHHGTRLQIAGIDASQPAGAATYADAARRHGLPESWSGEPTVVVADELFAGADAIAIGLGDDFDTLARAPESASWPNLAGLPELLPDGIREVKTRLNQAREAMLPEPGGASAMPPEAARDDIANGLAIAVLIGMVVALIHSVIRVRRASSRGQLGVLWIPLLVLIGLGISGYTAYASFHTEAALVCGPIGSCDAVQRSEYAQPFGISLGILGLLGYGAVLATWVLGRRLSPGGGGWRWLSWGIACGGTLFSVRLTYLEPFVIGHTCLWCLGSAITITLILWLLSAETRAPPESAAREPG